MSFDTLRRGRLVAISILAAALLGSGAPSASAATVTVEGGTLTYRAGPGERNGVVLNGYANNRLRLNEAGAASITAWPASCERIEPEGVLCPVASSVRVELGDGDDSFSLYNDAYAHGLVVLGGDGDDELAGHEREARAKTFEGGPGKDLLKGYAGDDVLLGGPGNDILWGDEGNDELRGDDGDDQFKPDNGKAPGNDVIDGGAGFDIVESEWVELSSISPPPVAISYDGVANDGRPGEADNAFGIERTTMYVSGRFVLSDGADELTLFSNIDGGPSTVLAGGGNDRITGEDHEETIDGGAGDDVLEGGLRNDTIVGGPGRDRILGDESDTGCTWAPEYCLVFGNDTIDTRDGERDDINCGPGTDRLLADAIDVHAACETVEVAGGPDGPGDGPAQPGGPGADPDTGNPPGKTPRATPVTRKLRAALRGGLVVRVTDAAARQVRLSARYRGQIVATGTATVGARNTAVVRLHFRRSAKRALARVRSARISVTGAGSPTTITLTR